MGVFENRAQDARVTLAGQGTERAITGSEIDFGKEGSKIWVAILEGPGMWHSIEVSPKDVRKIMPLDWTVSVTRVSSSRSKFSMEGIPHGSFGRARASAARPREAVDRTAPSLMRSVAAVSATLRSR